MKKNKIKSAAALKYDGINAPSLIAKGDDDIAREIIQIAQENNVHIHNDPILLNVLSKLELGDEIPKELYLTVAKVIAFAYFLQDKHPKNQNNATLTSKKIQSSNQKPLN